MLELVKTNSNGEFQGSSNTLNEEAALVTKDMEKTKVLSVFFTVVISSKISLQESHVIENTGAWIKEASFSLGEGSDWGMFEADQTYIHPRSLTGCICMC